MLYRRLRSCEGKLIKLMTMMVGRNELDDNADDDEDEDEEDDDDDG